MNTVHSLAKSILFLLLLANLLFLSRQCPLASPCTCKWDDETVGVKDSRNAIDCSGNDFAKNGLPEFKFSNFTWYSLNLSVNHLDDLPQQYVSKLKSLEVLDLSHNLFQVFPAAIAGLPKLTKLLINNNNIAKTKPSLMLPKLKHLDLRDNKLSVLNNESFEGLVDLEILHLSKNVISKLSKDAFSGLSNLEGLQLSNNQINQIDSSLFTDLTNCKWLNMNGNKLSEIDNKTFATQNKLEDLSIRDNNLRTLYSDSFVGLNKLERLYLSNNQLRKLPVGLFRNTPKLRFLDLRSNLIASLEKSAFEGPQAVLQMLIFSYNQIRSFPPGFFQQFPSLVALSLTGLPMQHMPNITRLPHLNFLSIVSTGISSIYQCDFVGLTSLTDFHWGGKSPLNCNCNLRWLRQWWQKTASNVTRKITSLFPWKCERPVEVKGKFFDKMKPSEFECRSGARPSWCHLKGKALTLALHIARVDAMADSFTVHWLLNGSIDYSRIVVSYRDDEGLGGSYVAGESEQSLTVKHLTPGATYRICVEAQSLFHAMISRDCVARQMKRANNGKGWLAGAVVIPLLLVFGTAAVLLWLYGRRFGFKGRAETTPSFGDENHSVHGIDNLTYDVTSPSEEHVYETPDMVVSEDNSKV